MPLVHPPGYAPAIQHSLSLVLHLRVRFIALVAVSVQNELAKLLWHASHRWSFYIHILCVVG